MEVHYTSELQFFDNIWILLWIRQLYIILSDCWSIASLNLICVCSLLCLLTRLNWTFATWWQASESEWVEASEDEDDDEEDDNDSEDDGENSGDETDDDEDEDEMEVPSYITF